MTPGDDGAIDEDIPNYSSNSELAGEGLPASSGDARDPTNLNISIFDDERDGFAPADPAVGGQDDRRDRLHAIVDELFPADPAHEVHARPLMDRVREALHRMADEI